MAWTKGAITKMMKNIWIVVYNLELEPIGIASMDYMYSVNRVAE